MHGDKGVKVLGTDVVENTKPLAFPEPSAGGLAQRHRELEIFPYNGRQLAFDSGFAGQGRCEVRFENPHCNVGSSSI